jgi:hypothetical protein
LSDDSFSQIAAKKHILFSVENKKSAGFHTDKELQHVFLSLSLIDKLTITEM